MKLNNNFIYFIQENRGKVLGGLSGLIIAVLFAIFGFWKGILIILCILIGVFAGALVERNDNLQAFLYRFLRR